MKASLQQDYDKEELKAFLFETGLYAPISALTLTQVIATVKALVLGGLTEQKPVSAHCPICRCEAPIALNATAWGNECESKVRQQNTLDRGSAVPRGLPQAPPWLASDYFEVVAICLRARCKLHFWIKLTHKRTGQEKSGVPILEWSLTKVGQSPSPFDFLASEDRRLWNHLTPKQKDDMTRAALTHSHGLHAASLLYLRRVFEQLLDNVNAEAVLQQAITEESSFKARSVEDRVKILRSHLPEFVVKHPKIYGHMSRGIHELSEPECERLYPSLRQCINFILLQYAEDKDRKKLEKDARAAMQSLNNPAP